MDEATLIAKVKQICKKKPNERSNNDLQELQDLTKNTKVFKSLVEANGESAHQICCRYLLYEFCDEDNFLFKVGDLGTRFYIVISGKVGVQIPIKDEHSGETRNIEVVQIGNGGSFGELALESSKPRAASIKCKIPSHFVALEKVDYNRMIAKLVRDKRNNTVNFFQSLPIFSGITKGTLAKLTYNFKEKDFLKGQIVYREGDAVVDVYLVLEGEFLFQKRIVVQDGRKKKAIFHEPYTQAVEVNNYRAKALHKSLVQIGDIAKFGVGELFGIEELEDEPRKFTCICNSATAKVLRIPKSDFVKRAKGEDIFNYIQEKNLHKQPEFDNRTAIWRLIAEDKASSLSPIQARKRNQERDFTPKALSHTKDIKKSGTLKIFSIRNRNYNNEALYKLLDPDLKSITLSKPPEKKPSAYSRYHSTHLSKLKPPQPRSSPLLSHRPQGISIHSMNSKHIYDILTS